MTAETIADAVWIAAVIAGAVGTARHMWRTRRRPRVPEPRSHVTTPVAKPCRTAQHPERTLCERPHLEALAGGDEWDLALERHRAAVEAAARWHPSKGPQR